MPFIVHRIGRSLGIATILTTALLASPALSPRAHAIISGCGGDPIVVLSDGTTIDLSTTTGADASAVRQIAYTLHAPEGTTMVSVTSVGVRETLSFHADNSPGDYDTVTRVDASTSNAAVTTTTSVVPLLSAPMTGSATGTTNQDLRIELAS